MAGQFGSVRGPADVVSARLNIIQNEACNRYTSLVDLSRQQGLQRLVDHPQPVGGHNDQRQAELLGQVGHVVVVGHG